MKRDDYFIHTGQTVPEGGGCYAMMDDQGQYADPRRGIVRSVNVFPERKPADSICFGIGYALHGQCARYLAVDGASPDVPRMARCESFADFHAVA